MATPNSTGGFDQDDELDQQEPSLQDILDREAHVLTPEQAEAKAASDIRYRIEELGREMLAEVEKRISDRRPIEQRMMRDLNRYNGVYEADKQGALDSRKYGSKAFVPITRRVCNLIEARWADLMFPSEDRNFVIDPSPKPELVQAIEAANELDPNTPINLDGAPQLAGMVKQAIEATMDQAKAAAAAMQRTVDDQLKECDYPASARAAIRDAVVLGTGVLKGPVVRMTKRKSWSLANGAFQLLVNEDIKPVAEYVDPWHFFPDLSAATIKHSERNYQRHKLSRIEVLKLIGQPGFDEKAVRAFAGTQRAATDDGTEARRREASGSHNVIDERLTIYEAHGAIEIEDAKALGLVPSEITDKEGKALYECVIWFGSDGSVLKAVINMMDTEQQPFSVLNWQSDTSCIFGFGVSYELDAIQDQANSAFRAAQDNLGLTVGPQIVYDEDALTPVNGEYVIEPLKMWRKKKGGSVADAFGFFQIDARLSDILSVFNLCKQLAEDIGGPQAAMQGQDAPVFQQSATAASIANTSANIWMRRAVKQYDDQITTPLISRFVDWNMQYSDDDKIKGDWSVIARGTTALLAAEGQVQKVGQFIQMSQAAGVPPRNIVAQLRSAARAMRLDDTDLLPTDDEIKAMQEAAKQNVPQQTPEQVRLQIRQEEIADRKEDREFQAQQQAQNLQVRMAELAQKENLSLTEIQEKYGLQRAKVELDAEGKVLDLQDRREQRAHDAQAFNAEMAMKTAAGSGI